MENKFKELWFDTEVNSDNTICVVDLHFEKPEFETEYHVIDYAALESANAELKEAIDARDYWQLRASKSKMEKLELENKKLADEIEDKKRTITALMNTQEKFDNMFSKHGAELLGVIQENTQLRAAAEFYRNHADCTRTEHFGNCKCSFCRDEAKHREALEKLK